MKLSRQHLSRPVSPSAVVNAPCHVGRDLPEHLHASLLLHVLLNRLLDPIWCALRTRDTPQLGVLGRVVFRGRRELRTKTTEDNRIHRVSCGVVSV